VKQVLHLSLVASLIIKGVLFFTKKEYSLEPKEGNDKGYVENESLGGCVGIERSLQSQNG
jgi:hypothetical protein